MTEFLIRKLIKNSENVQDVQVRTRYGVVASTVGIICNVLLFAGKFLAGVVMHSIAVTADAFNNLSDAASSIISFVGMKMASKPADKNHPFGHGRIEYIAAFIVAFLVIEVGFTFFKSSIQKIIHPEAIAFELVPFIILGVSVLVKIWLGMFNKKLGGKINSKVLEATAADCIGDVAVTAATMAAILVGLFFKINIDGIAGLLVSLVVMWAGINIAKDTLEPLIGEAIDPELCEQIITMVEGYDGILGTHDLIVHNYGPNKSMASVHAEVPRDVDIETSHEIIDRIEREVSKKLGIFLVIHMDPVETRDQELLKAKKQVHQVLAGIDEQITFHDFRMVNGENQINLIFDVVMPYSYSGDRQNELLSTIINKVKEVDSRYECVITVDKSFVGTN
ncbi:MAG: cation diffusion facilitator family transporter [Lachnospiraceae bacterium]|nr:cation diffusion facilitator family transporter [Lachnospiraceae bacterium]